MGKSKFGWFNMRAVVPMLVLDSQKNTLANQNFHSFRN